MTARILHSVKRRAIVENHDFQCIEKLRAFDDRSDLKDVHENRLSSDNDHDLKSRFDGKAQCSVHSMFNVRPSMFIVQ